jgi:hypothetical protein
LKENKKNKKNTVREVNYKQRIYFIYNCLGGGILVEWEQIVLEKAFREKRALLTDKERRKLWDYQEKIDTFGLDDPENIVSFEDGNQVKRVLPEIWTVKYRFENKQYFISIKEDSSKLLFINLEVI